LEAEAIVLDHHETTRGVVGRFIDRGLGAFGDMKKEPGACGATLAYEHIWKHARHVTSRTRREAPVVEDLAILAGIRDTWQKQDPRWLEACEQAAAMNFWDRETLVNSPPEKWRDMLKPIGKQAYANHLRNVRRALKGAYKFITPGGLRAVVFQGYIEVSDAADMVEGDADVIVGFTLFFEDSEPYALFGLRSRNDDINVGKIAEASAPGGGGHAKSAGFRKPLLLSGPNPFGLFRDILIDYEANHCTCGEDDGDPLLPHKSWCSQAGE
jgi:nanoRNase/pAp phosphatase (c-di-AMP/oligoRNAs hydrolase)